ncbi:hypothetical protein SCUCBS95973_001454 [Sporothrix curviconia]|uniref:CFEM domain-containing protein n=1 Tax=Sporothrix curviconia TaxID=1260050 RepID=A0ABP0AYR5_9PEZI
MKLSVASLMALTAAAGRLVAASNDESLVIQANDDNTITGYAAQVPVCANLCFFQAAVAVGCETDDYHCQCADDKHDQLVALTHNCLDKSCSPRQAKDAHKLASKICSAVKRGLPVVHRRAPEPAPQPVPEPFPAPFPEPVAFPGPAPTPPTHLFTERDVQAAAEALLAARGEGCGTAVPTTVQTVQTQQGSSIPSSIVPATAASSPSSVATAGAALHRVPAAAVAGAVAAVAGALLL